MAFKKKVKLKYGEWEVPAGGQTVPNPLPLQPGASPPLLPQEVGSTPGEEDSRERLFPHPPSLSFFSFNDKCPVIWAPLHSKARGPRSKPAHNEMSHPGLDRTR